MLAKIGVVARAYPIDALFLDFVRWPLHWEIELRPDRPRPLDSSFDATTLAKFEEATGIPPRAGLDTTVGEGGVDPPTKIPRMGRFQVRGRDRIRR